MAGEQLGRRVGEYIFANPTTTLDFDYSDAEIDEIRSGRLPGLVAARVNSHSKTVQGRALKVLAPTLLVFVLISAGIAATAENGRVAAPAFVMGCFGFFAGILLFRIWRNFSRPAKTRTLKMQTLRAYKSKTDFSVRFGQTAMTGKSWSMDKTAYGLINGDALYNVYSAADLLIYLEEVE